MAVTSDDHAQELEEIDRDECLRLLATRSVGRLAVAEPGQAPLVVPVNYALVGESIVFRSDPGTKLRLLVTEPVSFQVDDIDPAQRSGWSVLLQGLAYRASEREIDEAVHLHSFAPGRKDYWVRLVPKSITGRRIRPG